MILRWDHIALYAAMTVVFTLEMLGVFKVGNFITITSVVRTYLPMIFRYIIIALLIYHFCRA